MPQAQDLTGLGMPGELATLLGHSANPVTCAGTTQATATTILTKNSELTTAASQAGAILPSNAPMGAAYYCYNTSGATATASVYCPVGHYINGTINSSVSLTTANPAAFIWQYKKGYWASVRTA